MHDHRTFHRFPPKSLPWRLALAVPLLCAVAALGQDSIHHDPLESASSGGVAAVDDALARLAVHRRLLMVAAHPDDEDTFLLTLVEKQGHGEAAYLSLSRGDGGQNLIGDELGEGLGLLRSRELEAARGIDGADQYFTRAYDFGYTRSIDETLERWPRETLLEDAMRVLRRHRPQVLVAVFPPTSAAGHGQHQASGWLAERLFELSRRPSQASGDAFADLELEPWRVESLFRAAWFRPDTATLRLPLGSLDPHGGRSIFQTALRSRSQHRCQDMGFEQPPGDAEDAVTWLAGRGGEADQVPGAPDIFAGVDTRLRAIAASLEDAALRGRVEAELAAIETLAIDARQRLVPSQLDATVRPLAEIIRRLSALLASLDDRADGRSHVRALLEEKLGIAHRGLAAAAGIVADAVSERELVRPGESFEVRTLLWRAGGELSDVEVRLESPPGWTVGEAATAEAERGFFTARVDDERVVSVEVPADADPDVPYFLQRPRRGDLYDWSGASDTTKTRAFGPPPLLAHFAFTVEGARVELVREVVHRRRDQALGEVRRPLRAVPAFEVSLDRSLIVWPSDRSEPETLRARILSHLPEAATVTLETTLPAPWPAVPPLELEIEARGRAEIPLRIEAPAELDAEPGVAEIRIAVRHGGERYARAYDPVDYEHIRPSALPVDARTTLRVVDLALPPLERVAYVRGASDRGAELLDAVGVPIELLDADQLMVAPLAAYDAVVLGPRAYEVEATLAAANARLLDYVRGGGLLIVQYQQYGYSRGGFAPLPLEIERPHDRITREDSPVRLALPEHRVFHVPNRIDEGDWQGWVQERGLYFAGSFDDAWQAPLALIDEGAFPDGEPAEEQLGGLLIAEVGDGHYVYTGLSFFRQLPAGVPGAYRLFANLLALD